MPAAWRRSASARAPEARSARRRGLASASIASKASRQRTPRRPPSATPAHGCRARRLALQQGGEPYAETWASASLSRATPSSLVPAPMVQRASSTARLTLGEPAGPPWRSERWPSTPRMRSHAALASAEIRPRRARRQRRTARAWSENPQARLPHPRLGRTRPSNSSPTTSSSRSLHPHPRKRLPLEHERKRASRAAA